MQFILVWFFIALWTLVDPAFHQRATSAASPEIGKKGILASILFWFLFDMLSIGTAMYALALLSPLPSSWRCR